MAVTVRYYKVSLCLDVFEFLVFTQLYTKNRPADGLCCV